APKKPVLLPTNSRKSLKQSCSGSPLIMTGLPSGPKRTQRRFGSKNVVSTSKRYDGTMREHTLNWFALIGHSERLLASSRALQIESKRLTAMMEFSVPARIPQGAWAVAARVAPDPSIAHDIAQKPRAAGFHCEIPGLPTYH